MAASFERFLNVRSACGATFDASGQRLYFLSTATGLPNLWAVRLDKPGAWPEPLAVGPERVQYVLASPRPGRVLFGLERDGDERTQLYLLNGPGNQPRALTDSLETIHLIGDWHRDGRTICYAANKRDVRHFDIYILDVESGEVRLVYQHDSSNRVIGFEPGGRRLLIKRVHSPFEHELLLVDSDDGRAKSLTGKSPPARYESVQWSPEGSKIYCATDREAEFLCLSSLAVETRELAILAEQQQDVDDLAVSPDGERVLYALNRDGYSEVCLRSLRGREEVQLVGPPGGLCYDDGRWTPTFDWSPDGAKLALSFTTATAPPDIWVAETGTGHGRRVTHSWDADLPTEALVKPELVRYPSFDGREIPAFVFRPSSGAPRSSRPALFYVHGGPESQLRPSFNAVIQYFASHGFVVVAPNVRGSTGYGKTYSHLDDVERRLDSVRDLAAGAEWLASSGEANPRKMAVMGASYGGYMVLAALTEHPELWGAGVSIVGIANFVTFLERTGPWRRRQREAEYGSLEQNRELLERLSPIHRADCITAPLMVVHGANDPRVPIFEAEQIVATLQSHGRRVEYLRFEDEGHGLVRLKNRLEAYPKIAAFLERHLSRSGD